MNSKSDPAAPLRGDSLLRDRLTEPEVADRLQLHRKTLSRARLAGRPLLPYVRISPRGIRYDAVKVEAYLERTTRQAAEVQWDGRTRPAPINGLTRSRSAKRTDTEAL